MKVSLVPFLSSCSTKPLEFQSIPPWPDFPERAIAVAHKYLGISRHEEKQREVEEIKKKRERDALTTTMEADLNDNLSLYHALKVGKDHALRKILTGRK